MEIQFFVSAPIFYCLSMRHNFENASAIICVPIAEEKEGNDAPAVTNWTANI